MSSMQRYGDAATRTRILDAAWTLLGQQGAQLKLADVAALASVSRQSVYLHFGDRAGLLLGLVHHMDETLDLAAALVGIQASPDGATLIEATMRLNTSFWRQVSPIARVLEAAQHHDAGLGAAWRDRMAFRLGTFRSMIELLDHRGELSDAWTVEEAATTLYAVAHFDTWRELVVELEWTDDHYVEVMSRLLRSALVKLT